MSQTPRFDKVVQLPLQPPQPQPPVQLLEINLLISLGRWSWRRGVDQANLLPWVGRGDGEVGRRTMRKLGLVLRGNEVDVNIDS
jgi:hypothetical protein